MQILIADDQADIRDLLTTLLELDGYDVAAVGDGSRAAEAIELQHPDVAIIDIELPGLDGYQVVTRIRANPQLNDVYLIAVTGHGHPGQRRRALECGFDAHLVKPVDVKGLTRLIATRFAPPEAIAQSAPKR